MMSIGVVSFLSTDFTTPFVVKSAVFFLHPDYFGIHRFAVGLYVEKKMMITRKEFMCEISFHARLCVGKKK